jgi:hypothetical protein
MFQLRLPIAAFTGHPIFPGVFTPIMAGNPADVKAVEEGVRTLKLVIKSAGS